TAVKLSRVESTGLEAAWEDRLLPVRGDAPALICAGAFFLSVIYNFNFTFYNFTFYNFVCVNRGTLFYFT
ncbi:MAG: hypothetical protein J5923_04145, partial [Acidaminococcaceae bacterium]|nr:hypothetical protein [Acidaminococcaceae bacterium]